MVDLQNINSKIVGGITGIFTKSSFIRGIGYLLLALIGLGGVAWYAITRFEKKKFNRIIKVHEIINGYFVHTYSDIAKPVKLGKGGFEIIYLKKLKTWKLAHGARSGKNEYNFYVLGDNYWYPGLVSADLGYIDKNKGLIQVIATNPTMRSQYTSLEKQIDSLHDAKKGFWDKYGQWVMTGAFIGIIGIFSWLSFREISQFLGAGSALADRMTALADAMNRLAVNLNNAEPSGLVPVP